MFQLKEPSLPYIIGLTGGSASGKSTICDYLSSLSIATINCDQLGHQAYTPGTECYNRIVQTFGEDILNEEKSQINRKVLGSKVFGNAGELKKLTDIVWPEIRRLALDKIKESIHQGHKIIVLDAAVLLEAGWDDLCHEVWVVFVPKDEVIPFWEQNNFMATAGWSKWLSCFVSFLGDHTNSGERQRFQGSRREPNKFAAFERATFAKGYFCFLLFVGKRVYASSS